jgi:hypothetical protein
MTKQGVQNSNQNGQQIAAQKGRNDVELGTDVQVGNSKHQSQKKSGKQVNKK